MRLLVVEDDRANLEIIRRGLEEEGYRVDVAVDGEEGLRMALEPCYTAILLDVMLPKLGGMEICRRLRQHRVHTPILMLTALGSTQHKIEGLETGADDYLPKPFDFAELVARVRALARRDKVNRSRIITIDRLEIDTGSQQVKCGGRILGLKRQEYLLLEALARYQGRTLSRDFIASSVWNSEDSYSNTVDVHIASLRKKVDAGYENKLIRTVHREGYVLDGPGA